MTSAQKQQFREIYNQLRLAIVYPGETIAGVTKLYAPVNKDNWTWEMAMSAPDTPTIARYRQTRETSMWCGIGVH